MTTTITITHIIQYTIKLLINPLYANGVNIAVKHYEIQLNIENSAKSKWFPRQQDMLQKIVHSKNCAMFNQNLP